MSIFKPLLFIFFLFHNSILYAQVNLDSLNTLLPITKGKERIDLLNKITWQVKFSNSARALKLCNESLALSKDLEYTQGEAQAFYHLAVLSYIKGDLTASLKISKQSILLFEKINNSLGLAKNWNLNGMNLQRLNKQSEALKNYEKALATCKLFEFKEVLRKVRGNIANLSYQKGDYKKAMEEYQLLASSWLEEGDSLNYYNGLTNLAKTQQKLGKYSKALLNYFKIESFEKSSGRKRFLANNYNDIGTLYLKLGLGDPTLQMFEKTNRLYQEIGNRRKVGITNINLGLYYFENEEFEKADYHYKKALQIYDSLGLNDTGRIYNNVAALRIKTNQLDEALILLHKSLKINLETENKFDISGNYVNMGAVYHKLGQIQKAEKYYIKALKVSEETGEILKKQEASEGLAKIYKQTNNEKAYQLYSSLSRAANDSLFAKQKMIELNRIVITKLEKEHKNKIKKLNKELSETKEQLAKKDSFFSHFKSSIIFLSAILILGIIWLVKKQNRFFQLNKKLENKVKNDQRKLETSLESKNKQLALLSLESAQQSDSFKKIHDSLQQIIAKNPENLEVKKLEKLMSSLVTDQNNWENFAYYFNKVYIGFFDRLTNSFPSITSKELRLCALIRLKIPSYEASIILGISPRSVHQSRYRLSKKMKLDTDTNIDDFINSI